MARAIIAVIVSYVTMFLLNFLAFVGLFLAIGPDNAFKPHRFLASNRWTLMAFAITFVTAVIAGLICAAIARGGKAPFVLAVVILVLGLLLAVPSISKARTNADLVRSGPLTSMEAAEKAYWPIWVPFTFPIVGAVGVLVGSKLKRRS